ncbi:MAG TPA: hypothetical protein VGO56_06815 [Pyrinomonadaceae bacterium]|nr:hypothetical protein [Pyrinomonadaceae bacterium]
MATARDKVQPNLFVARVADHATAGGSSFIKRGVRGVLRFTKSLFSAFGEGGSSISKVEPKSKDQDEVTIRSNATVYPPGFGRPGDTPGTRVLSEEPMVVRVSSAVYPTIAAYAEESVTVIVEVKIP